MIRLITIFLVVLASVANAQNVIKQLEKADEYRENWRYQFAIPIYEDLLKFDKENAKANYGLGMCYLESTPKNKAYIYLKKANELKSGIPDIEFNLGKAFQYANKFTEAIYFLKQALEKTDQWKQKDKYNFILKKISECERAPELMAFPVKAKIENLGATINSKYQEYAPVLSRDEKKLVFTSRRKGSSNGMVTENGDYFEDIYISYKQNGQWTEPLNLGSKANTEGHDAAISISPDGYEIFIYRDDNGGDIFVTDYNSQEWSEARPFSKKINTKYNESSITMFPDGKTIYFTSDRPGGFGGKDIYKSTKDEKGNWNTPINAGPTINTAFDEDAPFIHVGKTTTMYFSSRGHGSIGGYDVFKSDEQNGAWTTPENLGYPINTTDDDIYFVISADDKRGYYSSVKDEGFGESDIYQISMPEPVQIKKFEPIGITPFIITIPEFSPVVQNFGYLATPFVFFKGTIAEEETKVPIQAKIQAFDVVSNVMVKEITSNPDGSFELPLLSGQQYGIRVEKEPYLFYSDNIETSYSQDYQLYFKDIFLQKMKVGSRVVLKNIFFETNKALLEPISEAELDKLYTLLINNTKLKLEISGHTDNIGNTEYNKKLSTARAKSVVDYLKGRGISSERLKFAGYGSTRPVAENDFETGRMLNRRTEFEIIGN